MFASVLVAKIVYCALSIFSTRVRIYHHNLEILERVLSFVRCYQETSDKNLIQERREDRQCSIVRRYPEIHTKIQSLLLIYNLTHCKIYANFFKKSPFYRIILIIVCTICFSLLNYHIFYQMIKEFKLKLRERKVPQHLATS